MEITEVLEYLKTEKIEVTALKKNRFSISVVHTTSEDVATWSINTAASKDNKIAIAKGWQFPNHSELVLWDKGASEFLVKAIAVNPGMSNLEWSERTWRFARLSLKDKIAIIND